MQQYESQMITAFANLIQVPMEYVTIVYEQQGKDVHICFRYPITPDVTSIMSGATFTEDLTSSLSSISGEINSLLGYGMAFFYGNFVFVLGQSFHATMLLNLMEFFNIFPKKFCAHVSKSFLINILRFWYFNTII